MRKTNPIRGLLRFYYYAQSGNITSIALYCLLLAAAAVATGHFLVIQTFNMVAVMGLPYIVIVGMGTKEYPIWERFRITMPIKRSHLISTQYLIILLASLAGIPLLVLVTVLTYFIHQIDYSFATTLINALSVLAMPLLFVGLIFPIGNTKFGENRLDALFLVCFAIVVGVYMVLVPQIGNWLELADSTAPLVMFAVSFVAFVASYFVTRGQYARRDF